MQLPRLILVLLVLLLIAIAFSRFAETAVVSLAGKVAFHPSISERFGVFLALRRAGMGAYRALSYITVRIMEPFWLFAAVLIALPALERGKQRVAVLPARVVGHPA